MHYCHTLHDYLTLQYLSIHIKLQGQGHMSRSKWPFSLKCQNHFFYNIFNLIFTKLGDKVHPICVNNRLDFGNDPSSRLASMSVQRLTFKMTLNMTFAYHVV